MRILTLFIGMLLMSCSSGVKQQDLPNLEGYWRISKAVSPSGEVRTFTATVDVDFFQLDEKKGLRKKLKPLLGNQYSSSNNYVPFTINCANKNCIISYSKKGVRWEEEIMRLDAEELRLKDARGVVFHYIKT